MENIESAVEKIIIERNKTVDNAIFSEGRYALMSCEEWQIKENGLFGKHGLDVFCYDKL